MQKPVVLVFSGLDPTGGAGTQADIEALHAAGCHPLPIVTALTVQDTHTVYKVVPISETLLLEQANTLFQDFKIAAIKIGLLGNSQNALAISRVIKNHPTIPVVLDPILQAGGGTPLANESLIEAMVTHLLPHTTLMTPNVLEAQELVRHCEAPKGPKQSMLNSGLLRPQKNAASQRRTIFDIPAKLLQTGCQSILITGTESGSSPIQHSLFLRGHPKPFVFSCERLEGVYHGSGCTLASCAAGFLAQGMGIKEACEKALSYTWQTLKYASRLGKGQQIPNRLFFCDHLWSPAESK